MYRICDECADAKASCAIKGGCGCLVHLCDECVCAERKRIQHEKCIVCRGGKTPQQRIQEEEQDYIDHMNTLERGMYDDDIDDLFFDDLDYLDVQREQEEEERRRYEREWDMFSQDSDPRDAFDDLP